MRVVFMGTPACVLGPVRTLFEAQDNGIELVGVVTQPDRPQGRGRKLQPPPVAIFAKENQVPLLQPEKASSPEFLAALKELKPDIIVTAAYGQILTQAFLEIPKRGTLNIHPSLLPAYRGATPVAAALLDGLTETGISILFTVKQLDAGNIIIQKRVAVPEQTNTAEFTQQLFDMSGPLLLQALKLCEDATFIGAPQDPDRVSFCGKINKEDGLINWSDSAQTIWHKYRAYTPWPGIYCNLGDQKISIHELHLVNNEPQLPPGRVEFSKPRKALIVGTGSGHLAITRLQRSGAKPTDAISFWNGQKDRDQLELT